MARQWWVRSGWILGLASAPGCSETSEPGGLADHTAETSEPDSGPLDSAEPWEPWCAEPVAAVAYQDVAESWGVVDTIDGMPARFEHNPVAMADMDGDGDDDLILATRENGVFLQRNEEGVFSQELLSDVRMMTTIALADVDSDRDLDMVLAGWSSHLILLRNDGNGVFEDATVGSGLEKVFIAGAVRHATFGDLNGDGALDLYVTVATPVEHTGPEHLDRLFFGDGEGHLVEASEQIADELRVGLGWGSIFVDFDRDGDSDLYTVNAEQSAHGPSRLLQNDGLDETGSIQMTDLSDGCGCDWTGSTMGVSEADFNHDGLPDFYLTNTGPSRLLLNLGDGLFADAAAAMGAQTITDPNGMTYGAAIYDFDNDGWLDILASAGPLHGDFPISSQPSEQPDVLLRGGADGFTDVSVEQGVDDLQAGRGVAVGLLDDDGMMEAVVTHLDSPTRLFRSGCTANRALVIDLVGHAPNTFGVGARIEVDIGDRVLSRVIRANGGWASSIHPRAHFGLGDSPVESARVIWPSGTTQELDVGRWVDGRLVVEEP